MRNALAATLILALVIWAGAACSRTPAPDAYGNVEATEVVVSSETAGQLLAFSVSEGQTLEAGAVIATVDRTQLALEHDQLSAQRAVNQSRVIEAGGQIGVLEAQRAAAESQRAAARAQRAALEAQVDAARRQYERTERLFAQEAATAQQREQAERDFRVLEQQIRAQEEQVEAQTRQIASHASQIAVARAQRETAARQVESADAQVARAADRLRKTEIRNPAAGTVLVTYVQQGELVQNGQPLYKIANLAEVDVRAYVTEPQLGSIRVGQVARIGFDRGSGQRQTVNGTISWIASESEFTPTPIQTRDERADLVYAIKLRVMNRDGMLKIGMPVDVQFAGAAQ